MIAPNAPASAAASAASAPEPRDPHPQARPDRELHVVPGAGRRVLALRELSRDQLEAARRHYVHSVFPALTPLAVDPGHPFPHLRNDAVNLAVSVRRRGGPRGRPSAGSLLAVVQVPAVLPRLVPLPCEGGGAYALLEEIVADGAGSLFPGHQVDETAAFRVLTSRGPHAHERSETRPPTGRARVRRRERDATVQLELAAGASAALEDALVTALKLDRRHVRRVQEPLHLPDLLALDLRR